MVVYSDVDVYFFMCTPVPVVGGTIVTLLIGRYSMKCASRNWAEITDALDKCSKDKQKIAKILHELVPGDVLTVLQRLDVSRWHEISKSHESVAVVFCTIQNLSDLVRVLTPAQLVVVMHTVFSVCDRILEHSRISQIADLTKIETVEGTHVVASGLNGRSDKYVYHAYTYANEVIYTLHGIPLNRMFSNLPEQVYGMTLEMSGGVGIGPVLSGVVGRYVSSV